MPQEYANWQEALSDLVTDPQELVKILDLDPVFLDPAVRAARLFPLKVPRAYLQRIKKGDPNDPLLKQVLPIHLEFDAVVGYSKDPLLEGEANPVPGLLHKYQSRVLVTLTSACAIHCRYCFRRHFPYADNNPGTKGWQKIFDYISEHPLIDEVILSGGDALAVSDKLLNLFSSQLDLLPQIKRLRIHTRLPIVLPSRITDVFVGWLKGLKQAPVIVVHANHPNEIDQAVVQALSTLRVAQVPLFNQSVLLKGVNDDALVLAALSNRLFEYGVVPYYLHVLDKVQGAAHFDIPRSEALTIHQEMTKILPGYLVPKLVCEEAGKPSKTIIR